MITPTILLFFEVRSTTHLLVRICTSIVGNPRPVSHARELSEKTVNKGVIYLSKVTENFKIKTTDN